MYFYLCVFVDEERDLLNITWMDDDLRDSKMLSHALFNPPNLYANDVTHTNTLAKKQTQM